MFRASGFGVLLFSLLRALLGESGQETVNRSAALEFGDRYSG
jgi:hypothetical protein